MKKAFCSIGLFLAGILLVLTACGDEEGGHKAYDIEAEREQIFSEESIPGFWLLSTLFYQEEPAQLWAERRQDESNRSCMDVWLYQANGDKELLLKGIDAKYYVKGWYTDGEGNYYVPVSNGIAKLDSTGKELFYSQVDGLILDICEQPNERLILLVWKGKEKKLMWLEEDTGIISEVSSLSVGGDALKLFGDVQKKNLYLLDKRGILVLDTAEGSKERVFSFGGTSYEFPDKSIGAFRMDGEDRVELLLSDGKKETLRFVDISKTRTVLVLRVGQDVIYDTDGSEEADLNLYWLKGQVIRFNQTNDVYYVVMESCGQEEELDDYRARTGIRIATGENVDIVCGTALERNIYGLLEKGAFVDLNPFMEADGTRQEDFFSSTFSCWELDGKIYGICVGMDIGGGMTAERDFLGDLEEITLDSLTEALLAYPGDAFYKEGWPSERVLRELLQCSQSVGGTIDWEKGSCDFEGKLFSQVLMAAKRFGYDERKDVLSLFQSRTCYGLDIYDDSSWVESQGKVIVDSFFDDGQRLIVENESVLAISANSRKKEGAWQFIQFLLGEEAQEILAKSLHAPESVSRAVFEEMARKQLEEGPVEELAATYGKGRTEVWHGSFEERMSYKRQQMSEEEMMELLWRTQEEVDEIRTAMERARSLPLRTMPILDIICEEADAYFKDMKTIEEVCEIIANRVQLYLDEG